MSYNIKCVFININSLVSITRRHYLQNFINQYKPEILLIAEHKLADKHNFYRGFKTFKKTEQMVGDTLPF